MKEILKIVFRLLMLFIILFLVTRLFKRADESLILSPVKSYYAHGSAPDSVRIEVIKQLHKFQDGYTKRDVDQVESFMQELYSRDNILILGTMPGEVFKGFDRATYLVETDWESWGDCKFMIDSANISSKGDVVWFSTRGYVKFDLSRLLVIPLRLTGVMVNENGTWKFQQQQFQFDIDFSFSLVATLLLSLWICVCFINLAIKIYRLVVNERRKR